MNADPKAMDFLGRNPLSESIDSVLLSATEASELREKYYNAAIIERIDFNEDLARFRIRPDSGVPSFEPGQYVTLGLGNWEPRLKDTQPEQVPEKKLRRVSQRAYSISCPLVGPDGDVATVDSVDYLEFYVTLVRKADAPDQKPPVLTPRLFNLGADGRIMVGKKVTGHYVLGDVKPDETVLMLGTGTGEAPHNAMAAKLLAANHRGRIINVTSVRFRNDLAYVREHEQLMKSYPQYCYLAYTTREAENLDPDCPGYVGKQYLQQLFTSGRLAEAAGDPLDPQRTHVFLCGNPAMIGYVPPGGQAPSQPGMLPLLREAGFTDESDHAGAGSIRFEKYW